MTVYNWQAESVAVISHGYWNRRFGGLSTVLEQQIRLDGRPFAIVGVAPVGFFGEAPGESPDIWTSVALLPAEMRSAPGLTWLNLIGRLRSGASLQQAQTDVEAGEVLTLAQRLDRKLVREHLVADLAGFFGGLTLLLVSIGVYGTLAYTAARRTREIGVRLALGSRRGAVIWIMMRDVVMRLGVGVVLGGMGVLAGGRLVGSLLFGLRPTDVPTIASAILLLSVVALLAGYIPTFRASRLDPASVLRE